LEARDSVVENFQKKSDAAGFPAHFDDALKAIKSSERPYIILNKQAAIEPGFVGSEEFAERAYAHLFANPIIWTKSELADFFRWAVDRNPPCKFALVLATMNALKDGDLERAARCSREAFLQLPEDLFIQKLDQLAARRKEAVLVDRFCRVPFESIETAPNGDVHFCCPAWLPVPIGNLDKNTHEQIWNSPTAQAVRQSIHDGSYRYCSRVHCAHLSSNSLPRRDQIKPEHLRAISQAKLTRLTSRPRKLVLAHDRSCTLSCPSCRTKIIVASHVEQIRLNRMADDVLLPLTRDALRIRITSSGDPFGSGHFRYVMKELDRQRYPRLVLEIQTNGVLFDEAAWREFDLVGRLGLVAISLDSANEETYSVVRRGGSFRRLQDNLDFLAGRRKAGEISLMRLDFVVQGLNYREMPEMLSIADRYGFDKIKFQMIRNWHTYSAAEFAKHDIGSRYHPRYQEFLEILNHPQLRSERVELWGMRGALDDAKRLAAGPETPPAR
jgi:sulfatase maturation enzyme AslB (radical SAM superfamily)